MPKSTWVFAGILSGLVLIALGWLQLRTHAEARDRAEAAAAEAKAAQEALTSTNATLVTELQGTLSRIEELEQAVAQAEKTQAGLEQQMRNELESRDVTISELRGKLTVDILDRILFASGEARLKPEGEAVLSKVAQVLSRFPNRSVQIVGHTDNVPIRNRTPDGFTDNWALSAGRAVSALRYLTEKASVDARRLSAVGCGEFHPIAANDTPEGRARNRRIAVVVLPEEFAAPDAKKTKAPKEAEAPEATPNP